MSCSSLESPCRDLVLDGFQSSKSFVSLRSHGCRIIQNKTWNFVQRTWKAETRISTLYHMVKYDHFRSLKSQSIRVFRVNSCRFF